MLSSLRFADVVHEVEELWIELDTGVAELGCRLQEFSLLSFIST